jgi:hypothetical protein
VDYSILNRLGVYLKAGLFQTETHAGKDSDWGLGVGIGLRGCIVEFQQGNIRIGVDGQVFRSQTDYNSQSVNQGVSTEEDITWTEYQLSVMVSWRAYHPVCLYTGVELSMIDVEYDVSTYHWQTNMVTEDYFDAEADQIIALVWGVTYQIADNVHLYGELSALSELSASIGFNFTL